MRALASRGLIVRYLALGKSCRFFSLAWGPAFALTAREAEAVVTILEKLKADNVQIARDSDSADECVPRMMPTVRSSSPKPASTGKRGRLRLTKR